MCCSRHNFFWQENTFNISKENLWQYFNFQPVNRFILPQNLLDYLWSDLGNYYSKVINDDVIKLQVQLLSHFGPITTKIIF